MYYSIPLNGNYGPWSLRYLRLRGKIIRPSDQEVAGQSQLGTHQESHLSCIQDSARLLGYLHYPTHDCYIQGTLATYDDVGNETLVS